MDHGGSEPGVQVTPKKDSLPQSLKIEFRTVQDALGVNMVGFGSQLGLQNGSKIVTFSDPRAKLS